MERCGEREREGRQKKRQSWSHGGKKGWWFPGVRGFRLQASTKHSVGVVAVVWPPPTNPTPAKSAGDPLQTMAYLS